MAEGLTWNEGESRRFRAKLNTSNARGRWTGFKAQSKDINGKNCVNLVPSVMQNVDINELKSFSVNVAIIFRVRESVATPVPVAARSKACVYGRTPAEIVGFESHRGHGRLSVVSVVCCQVEVSATN